MNIMPIYQPASQRFSSPQRLYFKSSEKELKDVADSWDQAASAWSSYVDRKDDLPREYLIKPTLYKMLGDVTGLKILDAGCGEGDYCRELSKKGAKVSGLDISPRLISEAKRKKQGIQYDIGSFTNMQTLYPAQSFDRLISVMTLMDSPDLNQAFREFHRVLKDDGKAVLVVKHPFATRKNGADFTANKDGKIIQSTYTSPYASSNPFTFHMKVPPINGQSQPPILTTHYPRSVAQYLNSLIQNGFEILELQESIATPDMVKEQPTLAHRAFDPVHLIIKIAKKHTDN